MKHWHLVLVCLLACQACSYQWSEEEAAPAANQVSARVAPNAGPEIALRVAYAIVGAEGTLSWHGVLQNPPALLPLVLDPRHGGRAGYVLLAEGQEVKEVYWQGASVAFDARRFDTANPDGSIWAEVALPNLQPVSTPASVDSKATRFVGAHMGQEGARHYVVPVHSQGDLAAIPTAIRSCRGLIVNAHGHTLAGVTGCESGILSSQELPRGYAVQGADAPADLTAATSL